MEQIFLDELREIKKFTLLNCKKALTVGDASVLTGLSTSHIHKLVMWKRIPCYKATKLVYFDRDELNAWMLRNRVKTQDEIEAEAVSRVVTGKAKRAGNSSG